MITSQIIRQRVIIRQIIIWKTTINQTMSHIWINWGDNKANGLSLSVFSMLVSQNILKSL